MYGDGDLDRLYRIRLLRSLGLSLTDIARTLDSGDWTLPAALHSHLRQVEAEAARASALRSRLQTLVASLSAHDATPDELLRLLEDMNMDSMIRDRISILVYRDIPATHAFLVRAFGFRPGELTYDGEGRCVHGELYAGDGGTIWLHPETSTYGLASPQSLGSASATMAVMVDDVDDHHRLAAAQGAEIVYPPVDQPYGYREYSARDPEGGFWSFMKPLDA